MNWYYAAGSERKGPLEEGEFFGLVERGMITADTLVWKQGMENWQPYGKVSGEFTPGSVLPSNEVVCAQCGRLFPPDLVIQIGNRWTCAGCKPLVVQRLREGAAASDAEQIRREHIKHEASVKSIGSLYFLWVGLMLFFLAVAFFSPRVRAFRASSIEIVVGSSMFALFIPLGIGMRRLRRWARIGGGILSVLGLLMFPLGTLINAYILYLLFSKKGKMVFSDEYQRVIEETPHIKYGSSSIIRIAGIVLLVLLLFGALMALSR